MTVPELGVSPTVSPWTGAGTGATGVTGGSGTGACAGVVKVTAGEDCAPAALVAVTRTVAAVRGASDPIGTATGLEIVCEPAWMMPIARQLPSASWTSAVASVASPLGFTLAVTVPVVGDVASAVATPTSGGTVTRTRYGERSSVIHMRPSAPAASPTPRASPSDTLVTAPLASMRVAPVP